MDPNETLKQLRAEVSAFICKRTALWRSTWVLPIIDALLRGSDADKAYLQRL